MSVCHLCAGGLQRPENTGSPGCGITDGCEPLDVGAGIRTQVLCKSSKCSLPLGHLSNPEDSAFKSIKPSVAVHIFKPSPKKTALRARPAWATQEEKKKEKERKKKEKGARFE